MAALSAVPSLNNEKSFDADPVKIADSETASSHLDPEAERKLVRKLDWALIPLFTLICETLCKLFKYTVH